MTLDLSPEQPPEVPEAQPAAEVPAPLRTVVTTDAVVVRIYAISRDGAIALVPSGNRASLSFDRFQAAALRSALALEI